MDPKALAFVSANWAVPPETVELKPIRGGLESAVARARVRPSASTPAEMPRRFVIKELRGVQRREAAIYRSIWDSPVPPPAARVFGIHPTGDADYLFLEDVRAVSSWPWRDQSAAAAVCRELARLHDSAELLQPPGGWDYEAELQQSAEDTLASARSFRGHDGLPLWSRPRELERVVSALGHVRRHLLGTESALIHGDVHPGNVIVRAAGGGRRVALIDWARARVGSPLEDIASWLHSLGCWEPESRRRHDSLLAVYLASRSVPRALTRALRRDYWLASACNGLAGAIRYHLAVLANADAPEALRRSSAHALGEWQRLIRGAYVVLRASDGRYSEASPEDRRFSTQPQSLSEGPDGRAPRWRRGAP